MTVYPKTEGRRCEICHRRSVDIPSLGGITRFAGLWAHVKCYRQAQKAGKILLLKGQPAKYLRNK